MAKDNRTYGFSLTDAESLAGLIGGRAEIIPGRQPVQSNSPALYQFETTADYSTGTSVAAEILTMAGATITATGSVSDPAQIFTGIASGTKGLAIYQGGVYYIIQAACGT